MAKNFQLAPDFFNRAKFGSKPLTYPDRVRLTVEAIRNGTHAIFCGGWLSFNGEMEVGEGNGLHVRSCPPLGCNFVYWEHYNDFWISCLDHLLQM